MKAVAAGINPMDLKRGIDKAVNTAVDELKKLSKPCKDRKAIAQVGTISANSDESIGEIIAEAMEKVGKEGVITVEEGSGLENELDVVEGMQFDRGYLSPYFINNQQNMSVRAREPADPAARQEDLATFARCCRCSRAIAKSGRPLLMIAEDVEGEALATLVVNTIRGIVKVCAVKAPGFGDRRKAMLQDIAILTGGKVISEEDRACRWRRRRSTTWARPRRSHVTKENTTIIDGAGKKPATSRRASSRSARRSRSRPPTTTRKSCRSA